MFDWTTKLGPTLLRGTETVDTTTALEGKKYVVLYFSANYCTYCHKFTPLLSVLYEDQNPATAEVVFVSNDKNQDEFDTYREDMSWLAVPYTAEQREQLMTDCEVTGIPQLTVFDVETGALVARDARTTVTKKRSLGGPF